MNRAAWIFVALGLASALGGWLVTRNDGDPSTVIAPSKPSTDPHGNGSSARESIVVPRAIREPRSDGDTHDHGHDHDHSLMSDDEHARAHAATLPSYVKTGERPEFYQILAFGAAGGMIPCPASVSVMLLALSVGKTGMGMLTVLGFSLGLAITLVSVGMAVVMSLRAIGSNRHFEWLSRSAPAISAGVVMLSGAFALLVTLLHPHH